MVTCNKLIHSKTSVLSISKTNEDSHSCGISLKNYEKSDKISLYVEPLKQKVSLNNSEKSPPTDQVSLLELNNKVNDLNVRTLQLLKVVEESRLSFKNLERDLIDIKNSLCKNPENINMNNILDKPGDLVSESHSSDFKDNPENITINNPENKTLTRGINNENELESTGKN